MSHILVTGSCWAPLSFVHSWPLWLQCSSWIVQVIDSRWGEILFHLHNIFLRANILATALFLNPQTFSQHNKIQKRPKRMQQLNKQPTIWCHVLLVSCQIIRAISQTVSLTLRNCCVLIMEVCRKIEKGECGEENVGRFNFISVYFFLFYLS